MARMVSLVVGLTAGAVFELAWAGWALLALLLAAPGCATSSSTTPTTGAGPAIELSAITSGAEAQAEPEHVVPHPSSQPSEQAPQQSADADGQITLTTPTMVGPLTGNPNPMHVDAGNLGPIYVTGAVSGLGMLQSNEAPGDEGSQADVSNAQVIVQKSEGVFQYYAQAGAYSLPALGTTYVRSSDAADAYYGTMPTAYVRLAPGDGFSIMAGKLPTLFGAEYTFTFQNMNIERGLLWNQENAINQGVQANLAAGPVALSVSVNDGFYSGEYKWLTGAATYTMDGGDSFSLYGGGNFDEDSKSTLATPLAQNNSRIWGLIYNHTDGPWAMSPYVQYTDVPENSSIGIADDASTLGAAMLLRYAFDPHFSVAGRVEYIESDGSAASPNLLYGPDSDAWSFTVTPTWQYGRFFVRPEASYVMAGDTTDGFAFGSDGSDDSQTRVLVEVGALF